jgi:D-alanyl-D-alanine carboxypeptidase/D-alanyl-D-alanine-endopeptidase (penicillin-binding protein 4)
MLFVFLAAAPPPHKAAPLTHNRSQNSQGQPGPEIQKIMSGPLYRYAEWGLLDIDPATGHVVNAVGPAQRMYMPGSTAKLFSVSAALDDFGFDYRLTTPVYSIGQLKGHILNGNLVLVAQGDLTMGGRTKPDGSVDYTSLDHIYANSIPGATLTPEDPLAGLNQIAQQVKAAGITHVNGNVIVDNRLFQPDPNFPDVPVPIIINDNLIDVVITPGKVGSAPASVTWRPHVAPYHLIVQATTAAAGQPTTIQVQTFPDGRILVTGQIAADAGQIVRTGTVIDPAAFARTALIEALARAGVSVSASATGANPASALPPKNSYQPASRVAAYVSPPFQDYAKLILKVSHNLGANLVVCLMAVKAGSTNCDVGLAVMSAFLDKIHVDRKQVALADGQGGAPVDRITPQAEIELLGYWLKQPESATFRLLLPILGVDGSLANVEKNSPSRGKVFAKTGTVLAVDPLNNRFIHTQALAGYLEISPNRFDVFELVVSNAAPKTFNDVFRVINDLGAITAILQQHASG